MRRVTQIALMVFVLLSITISAMSQSKIMSDISNSFNGQYTTLGQLMSDNVNANILGVQFSTRKSASTAVDKLFTNKTLSDYRLLHSGENNSSTFMVITIKTDGAKYRMNLLLKDNKITEIRIDQEE